CLGGGTLARAGLLRGRRATAFPSAAATLSAEGAVYTGEPVEIDGRIVTGRDPESALEFARSLVRVLAAGRARRAGSRRLERGRIHDGDPYLAPPAGRGRSRRGPRALLRLELPGRERGGGGRGDFGRRDAERDRLPRLRRARGARLGNSRRVRGGGV